MKRIYYLNRHLDDLISSQRGYKSTEEKMRALHLASRELFNYYNGTTSEYQKGLPMARVGFGLSTVVNDALSPFLKSATFVAAGGGLRSVLTNGLFKVPSDFIHPTSFTVPTAVEEVRVVNANQVTNRLHSPINGPTAEYPFVVAAPGGYYQAYPQDTPSITLHYLSIPPEPRYELLMDANGELELDEDYQPQYDDNNSVDHGWGEAQENSLIWLASKILAGENRDQYMQQFADLQAQKS